MTTNKTKCLIIIGGDLSPVPENDYDFIVACDKGYDYAKMLGIDPDLVLGDFDSIASIPDSSVPVERLPAEKDDTDTLYAVKKVLSDGYKEIHIACAFGGRNDHSLANIQTAAYIASNNAIAYVYGINTTLIAFSNNTVNINKKANSYLSVFSHTDICEGVTLTGVKYPLTNADLTNLYPIGVSNEWIDDIASITVSKGILIVMINHKK